MKCLFIVAMVTIFSTAAFSATYYVPDHFSTIQGAISDASVVNGDLIIVRAGTYKENLVFLGKAITVTSESGPGATVIDGMQNGSVALFQYMEGPDSVLEGFTLTNGSGTFMPSVNGTAGGAVCCDESSPTIRGNVITKNLCDNGAGIFMDSSDPVIDGNILYENGAAVFPVTGGGIYVRNKSNPVVQNNSIYNNDAYAGGGMCISNSSMDVVNNTIVANECVKKAAGIWVGGDNITINITNSILWANVAAFNPEIHIDGTALVEVTYTNIAGGYYGTGNIDEDPDFVDPTIGNLHLTAGSPCINRGTNAGAPGSDLDGDTRPQAGTADMGADEFSGTHLLDADLFSFSAFTQGVSHLDLEAGASNGSRNYIILISVTGNYPGIPLPGGQATLPVNWDNFTLLFINLLNSPACQNFLGKLDGSGSAKATFDTLTAVPQAAGITMNMAYALNNPWNFASNPIQIEITQ